VADLFAAMSSAATLGLVGITRGKGIFNTERDWYRFDWVDGMTSAAPAAYRRDSRFEVIVESDKAPDWSLLTEALMGARINSPEPT
jgi:hypothetical protein